MLLNARSWIPVVACVSKIRKICLWNAALAHGFTTSVSQAMRALAMMPAARNGRKSRAGLTPEALSAATSRSALSRPPAINTAISTAIGRLSDSSGGNR